MGWKGQVVESCSGAEASLLPLAEGLLRSPPHPQAVTGWGRLGHREPDVKTTSQQSRVAHHSVPAWGLGLPPSLHSPL